MVLSLASITVSLSPSKYIKVQLNIQDLIPTVCHFIKKLLDEVYLQE